MSFTVALLGHWLEKIPRRLYLRGLLWPFLRRGCGKYLFVSKSKPKHDVMYARTKTRSMLNTHTHISLSGFLRVSTAKLHFIQYSHMHSSSRRISWFSANLKSCSFCKIQWEITGPASVRSPTSPSSFANRSNKSWASYWSVTGACSRVADVIQFPL